MKKKILFLVAALPILSATAQTANTSPLPTGETVIGNHFHAGQGNEVWTDASTLYFNYRGNASTTHFWNSGQGSGKSVLSILSSGNVGISTTSPSSRLTIDGVDNYSDGITIQTTSSYRHMITGFFDGVNPTTGSALQFKVANNNSGGNTAVMTLKGSGNVGIGTTTVPEKLTVQGNIQIPLSNAIGYNISTDKLIHNGNSIGNYSLGWFWDSWQTGSPTGYLSSAGGLKFFTGSQPRVALDFTGKMGIGTMTPASLLDVNGEIRWGSNGSILGVDQGGNIELRGVSTYPYIDFSNNATQDYSMRIILSGSNRLNITGGNVGIGTDPTDAKLAVKGMVHSQEVKVDLTGSTAPDYVFEKDYKLISLGEIKSFIDQNKHLPEVPSAKEMEKNGLRIGEMNLLLLKKIEELTLHLITTNERLEKLEKENIELKKKIN